MKVLIIGAGVIGLSCAYYLRQEGAEVVVLDKSDMQNGCSYGNAGMIVPSHIIPLAAPGMIAQGIRWMFNPESPFYIKPRLNRALLSWSWKFYKAANKKHVQRSIPLLKDINLLSKELYKELATQPGFEFAFSERGLLMLYKTNEKREEEERIAEMANKAGITAKVLSSQEVKAMEDGIELDVKGGVYYPGDAHLDPGKFLFNLKTWLLNNNVKLHHSTEVQEIKHSAGKIRAITNSQEIFEGDELILASGSWSEVLASKLGLKIPLQAGKGYSVTLDSPEKGPAIPSILTEAKVAVTPMNGKLRFAGTMEIAGINHSINHSRVRGILKSIPQYLPDFKLDMPADENIWTGLRPCSPDGLPYIGKSIKYDKLTIATGHAMMGLSLGPATGKLVSEIVLGKKQSLPIEALSPNRYS